MSYFKKDGIVIKSKSAPISCNASELTAIINGWAIPLRDIPLGSEIQGVMTCNSEPWEEATELEFLVYSSERLKLLDHAGDEIRGLMYALNWANKSQLRLGLNDPKTALAVSIGTIEQKKKIVALTQHWYAKDRPNDDTSNSQWSYWIMRKRVEQPFVYLGTTIDTTEE